MPAGVRKFAIMLAAIPLIIGGVMSGTGVAAIFQGQALVAQPRQYRAVATAGISLFTTQQVQTHGGVQTVPEWSTAFRRPAGAGRDQPLSTAPTPYRRPPTWTAPVT